MAGMFRFRDTRLMNTGLRTLARWLDSRDLTLVACLLAQLSRKLSTRSSLIIAALNLIFISYLNLFFKTNPAVNVQYKYDRNVNLKITKLCFDTVVRE